jgi:aminopeptidase N
MRDFITGHTGINMSGWFDNWIFHAGTPHFSIDSFSVAQNGTEANVTVYLRQKRHGPAFIGNSNRLELTFMDNEWNRYDEQVQFDGETGSVAVNVPFIPVLLTIDMNELMCDATTDYSRTVKQTGLINFPNSFFKLDVQSVTDSAFFRIEHNWAPPDELNIPVQGLILSPYRYWKIDGIIPEGFQAQGVFHYNKTIFLDDSLLVNQNDSIVILYRPGTTFDWQFIPFSKIGTWSVGNLFVDDMQKGEYTIAVCDDTFVGINETGKKNDTGLYIFPNPTDGKINIDTSKPGYLKFYDLSGKSLSQSFFVDPSKTFSWDSGQTNEGILIVEFRSLDSVTITTEKIVLLKR